MGIESEAVVTTGTVLEMYTTSFGFPTFIIIPGTLLDPPNLSGFSGILSHP